MILSDIFKFSVIPSTSHLIENYEEKFYPKYYKVDKNTYIPFCNVFFYKKLSFLENSISSALSFITYNRIRFREGNINCRLTIKNINKRLFHLDNTFNVCLKKSVNSRDLSGNVYFGYNTILDSNFNTLLSIVLDGSKFLDLLNLGYDTFYNNLLNLDTSNLSILVSSKFLEQPYTSTFTSVFKNFLSVLINNCGVKMVITDCVDKILYENNKIEIPSFKTFEEQDVFVEDLKRKFYGE